MSGDVECFGKRSASSVVARNLRQRVRKVVIFYSGRRFPYTSSIATKGLRFPRCISSFRCCSCFQIYQPGGLGLSFMLAVHVIATDKYVFTTKTRIMPAVNVVFA